MPAIDMVEHHEQCDEHQEHRECAEDDPMGPRRGETHQIAGIRAEEAQVGRQNRLIAYGHLEMLDDAHDDGHGQQHRRGYPEPVEQHEQRQIQRADEQQVQHEHEVALGPHLRHETPAHDGTGQLHARAGLADAPLQRSDRRHVEHHEQDTVQPAGERLILTATAVSAAFAAVPAGRGVGPLDIQHLDLAGRADGIGHVRTVVVLVVYFVAHIPALRVIRMAPSDPCPIRYRPYTRHHGSSAASRAEGNGHAPP